MLYAQQMFATECDHCAERERFIADLYAEANSKTPHPVLADRAEEHSNRALYFARTRGTA